MEGGLGEWRLPFSERLSLFEEYWEAEAPRFAEAEATQKVAVRPGSLGPQAATGPRDRRLTTCDDDNDEGGLPSSSSSSSSSGSPAEYASLPKETPQGEERRTSRPSSRYRLGGGRDDDGESRQRARGGMPLSAEVAAALAVLERPVEAFIPATAATAAPGVAAAHPPHPPSLPNYYLPFGGNPPQLASGGGGGMVTGSGPSNARGVSNLPAWMANAATAVAPVAAPSPAQYPPPLLLQPQLQPLHHRHRRHCCRRRHRSRRLLLLLLLRGRRSGCRRHRRSSRSRSTWRLSGRRRSWGRCWGSRAPRRSSWRGVSSAAGHWRSALSGSSRCKGLTEWTGASGRGR